MPVWRGPMRASKTRGGLYGFRDWRVAAVHFAVGIEIREALRGRFEILCRDGRENSFFRHNESVAFIEQVVFPKISWREIDGGEIGAGAQAAPVTASGFSQIQ